MAATDVPDVDLDLSSKKKKKKKVITFAALDDGEDGARPIAPASSAAQAQPTEATGAGGDDVDFLSSKKKKKKKKAFDVDDAEADEVAGGADMGAPTGGDMDEPTELMSGVTESSVNVEAIFGDLDFPQRKKRKREKIPEEFGEFDMELQLGLTTVAVTASPEREGAWVTEDRDYHYAELLQRVFDIVRAKNPSMSQGEKRRFVMKPPQVIRLGSKKSGFINFMEIAKLMHREPEHLQSFLLAELGTSGTLDGTSTLVLKGRFQQKQMETVLRRYIKEYVTCHTCKSPDTILSKQRESRLYFLNCETCGAHKSVQSITGGFSAVIGKRSRIRAKMA